MLRSFLSGTALTVMAAAAGIEGWSAAWWAWIIAGAVLVTVLRPDQP